MSVNNISTFDCFNISRSGQNQLSEETKRKLQALGIDPSVVNSEAQAQTLIAIAQNRIQETINESSSKNTCCAGECELISKAKNLAQKLGIQTSGNENIENLINKLSVVLTTLESKANTDSDFEKINTYKTELAVIRNEYTEISQNQNTIMSTMSMTANINKLLLGIK